MAFTGNHVCTSFKVDLLKGRTNFTTSTGNTYFCALYVSTATLDATTTAYTSSGEHGGTGTYVAKGKALTIEASSPAFSGATAWADFVDLTWAASTITAAGALLYNDTQTSPDDPAVVVLDFGGNKSSSAGDFTIVFPPPGTGTSIIRIA